MTWYLAIFVVCYLVVGGLFAIGALEHLRQPDALSVAYVLILGVFFWPVFVFFGLLQVLWTKKS